MAVLAGEVLDRVAGRHERCDDSFIVVDDQTDRTRATERSEYLGLELRCRTVVTIWSEVHRQLTNAAGGEPRQGRNARALRTARQQYAIVRDHQSSQAFDAALDRFVVAEEREERRPVLGPRCQEVLTMLAVCEHPVDVEDDDSGHGPVDSGHGHVVNVVPLVTRERIDIMHIIGDIDMCAPDRPVPALPLDP